MRFVAWHAADSSVGLPGARATLPLDMQADGKLVTLVAPAAIVRAERAELEQAGPAPATRSRREKKASA